MDKQKRTRILRKTATGILVAVFAIVSGVIIEYSFRDTNANTKNTARQLSEEQAGMKADIIHELIQTKEHLSQLEGSVTENRKALNINYLKSDKNETNVLEQLESLELEMIVLGDFLSRYRQANEIADQDINRHLDQLEQELGAARKELAESYSKTRDQIRGLSGDQANSRAALEELLDRLKKDISNLGSTLKKSSDDMRSFLKQMEENRKADYGEEIKFLEQIFGQLSELTAEHTDQMLSSLEEESGNIQLLIEDGMLSLTLNLAELQAEIFTAKEDLSILLAGMKATTDSNQEEIWDNFVSLKEALAGIQDDYIKAYEEIKALHMEAADSSAENHSELVSVLGQMEGRMKDGSDASLSQLLASMDLMNQVNQESFESAANEMVANIQNMDTTVNGRLDTLDAGINGQLTLHDARMGKRLGELDGMVNNRLDTLNADWSGQMAVHDALMGRLFGELDNSVGGQVNNFKQHVDGRMNTLEDMVFNGLNSVETSFGSRLGQLGADSTAGNDRLKELITSGFDTANNNAGEDMATTLDALNEANEKEEAIVNNRFDSLDTKLSGQLAGHDTNISSQLTGSSTQINQHIDDIDAKMDSHAADVATQFNNLALKQGELDTKVGALESNINSKFTGLDTKLDNQLSTMEESVASSFNETNKKLESVFQSVSSGKKLLASALLTKTISVNEDATFQEIYQGIMDIPQQLTIGVDHIPGTIVYEYHSHTGDVINGGGCYAAPIYHVHSNGCYNIGICTVSASNCFNCHNNGVTYLTSDGDWFQFQVGSRTFSHSSCGAGTSVGGSGMHKQSEHGGASTSTHTYLTTLKCPKVSGQTVDAWSRNCNLAEGQIVGAAISYIDERETAPATFAASATVGTDGNGRHWHEPVEGGRILGKPYVAEGTASSKKGGCYMITRMHTHIKQCYDGAGGPNICGYDLAVWYIPGCGHGDGELLKD